MTATPPIALVAIEDALHAWVVASTGLPGPSVTFTEEQDSGAPLPSRPSALIQAVIASVGLSQAEVVPVPSAMQQRYTVSADGPGQVGVDFYLGLSPTPSPISYVAAPGELPSSSAAGLLAELAEHLPAGVTAMADPEDTASVLVDGTETEPQFAAAALDAGLLTVTTLRERVPELELTLKRVTARVEFRSERVRGCETANGLAARALGGMVRQLDPALRAVGWRRAGPPIELLGLPTDRAETLAALDVPLMGYATAAFQAPAARQIGLQATLATATA